LALSDRIAYFDVNFLELPGDLGADIDILLRLQLTLCGDYLLDRTSSDRDGA
jgi:hypothetical protein